MKITKEQTKKIAALARLGLVEKNVVSYSKDLSAILDYAEKLNEVDTKNVETTSQVTGLSNVKRPDEVKQKEITKEILDNTPLSKDDFIKVKNVF